MDSNAPINEIGTSIHTFNISSIEYLDPTQELGLKGAFETISKDVPDLYFSFRLKSPLYGNVSLRLQIVILNSDEKKRISKCSEVYPGFPVGGLRLVQHQ